MAAIDLTTLGAGVSLAPDHPIYSDHPSIPPELVVDPQEMALKLLQLEIRVAQLEASEWQTKLPQAPLLKRLAIWLLLPKITTFKPRS